MPRRLNLKQMIQIIQPFALLHNQPRVSGRELGVTSSIKLSFRLMMPLPTSCTQTHRNTLIHTHTQRNTLIHSHSYSHIRASSPSLYLYIYTHIYTHTSFIFTHAYTQTLSLVLRMRDTHFHIYTLYPSTQKYLSMHRLVADERIVTIWCTAQT